MEQGTEDLLNSSVVHTSYGVGGIYSYDVSIHGSTALVDLGRYFSFLMLYTVGRTPWTGDQSVARPISTHKTTQTQNKCTQISML
jgi:hypothetical protein